MKADVASEMHHVPLPTLKEREIKPGAGVSTTLTEGKKEITSHATRNGVGLTKELVGITT